MLKTMTIYTAMEAVAGYLSNELPNACRILSCREKYSALDGGACSRLLEFSVPSTHADSALVTQGAYVGFKDEDNNYQMYRIIEPVQFDGDQHIISASCEHVFYELLGEYGSTTAPQAGWSTSDYITSILSSSRWERGTISAGLHFAHTLPVQSTLGCLTAAALDMGAELNFRLTVDANYNITHRYVDFLTHRGAATGKQFTYSKDLIAIKYTQNIQNLCTAIIPRGKSYDIKPRDYMFTKKMLTMRYGIDSVVWTTGGGNPTNKPLNQIWIGDDTAKAQWGPAGGTRHIYGWVNFDEETDPAIIATLGWAELQRRKTPTATYEMTVILLESLTGYAHEAVRLGDTVNVINSAVTPAITTSARVIVLDKNLLDPSDAKVTLGNYIPTAQSSVAGLSVKSSEFSDREGVWDNTPSATYCTSRQDDTANTDVPNQLIQRGWGQVTHTATIYNSKAVAFPVAFDDANVDVFVQYIGTKATAGAPTARNQGTTWVSAAVCEPRYSTISANGFTMTVMNTAGANFTAGHFGMFSWVAIGTKAR
jgi:hypothetical protein